MKMFRVIIQNCIICVAVLVVVADTLENHLNNITYNLKTIQLKMNSLNMEKIRRRANDFFQTLSVGLKEDAKLKVPEIIKKYGYPAENHVVTTEDGYILTIHRIPHGKTGSTKNRPVMLLQHGLTSSSADWILPGPNKGLGYIMADEGFDVWIPNSRGNRYSRNHTRFNSSSSEFWQFSWHEIGIYDLPAIIDHILEETKQEKIIFTGHSQGTTVFYVLCSEKPEYNQKIKMHISLAPVVYMNHINNPLMHLMAVYVAQLQLLADLFELNEFVPDQGFLMALHGDMLCSENSVTQILCLNELFSIMGFNEKQMNTSMLPLMMAHSPAGSSTKQFLHYAQGIKSGKFRQWDYGFAENLLHYDSVSPPEYQLSNIKTPVYMFWSKNDWLSAEADVIKLCRELKKSCVQKFLVNDEKFNHIDYLYAIEAPYLVYRKLIAVLKNH